MPAIEIPNLEGMREDFELMASTPIDVTLDAFSWMCVLGAMQLAFRHPAYTGPSSDIVRQVAGNVQQMISLNERIAIILDMGWHPEFDVDGGPT